MQILNLRARGFIGFERGLGLPEINIDFSKASGLVAFSGQNGSSKSTCIELLSPFNQLASREGALFRHTFLRDSERELSFTYQGHHYKTLIKIDCDSEKSEGYIWLDGESVVNGKISAYAKYMKDLFGSPELFYNSVFCSQNAKKLSDLTTGKLKELFSEFLRLDRLVEYENTAKQAANVINGKAGQVDIRIAALKEKISGVERIREEIKTHQDKIETLAADLDCKKGELISLKREADKLKETISKNSVSIQRKADLQSNIDRLYAELHKEKTAVEAEIESQRDRYREINSKIMECNSILNDRNVILGAATKEKEINEYLDKNVPEAEKLSDEIKVLAEESHAIDKEIQGLNVLIKGFDNDLGLSSIDKEITSWKTSITEKEHDLKALNNAKSILNLENQIKNCKEKMAALDLKDPSCESTTCSFIVEALKAKEELPELENDLSERLKALDENRSLVNSALTGLKGRLSQTEHDRGMRAAFIVSEKSKLKSSKERLERGLKAGNLIKLQKEDVLDTARMNIERMRAELTKAKFLAGKQSEIQLTEHKKSDLEKQAQEIVSRGKIASETWAEKESGLKAVIQAERDKADAIVIDFGAEEKLKILNTDIDLIEKTDVPTIEKLTLGVKEKLAALTAELDRATEAEKELMESGAQKEALIKESSEWTYLKTACSKNGLQALEIDGAAPLITGYANDLLSQAFGPLFSVKFRTLDDEGKECLDIVTIADDGNEVLLENLSGGQRIWILMALRLAMTLLSKEKSGRVYESFFADELDGPLDPENSINFVNMYRAFMKIGGFKTGYFISHKPSCRSLAEHVLTFEPGENPRWA